MKVESMLPVIPMEGVTTPATKDRGNEVGKPTNPYQFHRGTPAY